MKKKYLPLYYKLMKNGIDRDVPGSNYDGGLCSLLSREEMSIFCPSYGEKKDLELAGLCDVYWGSGLCVGADLCRLCYEFTALRQNIILLMAAMNDEL